MFALTPDAIDVAAVERAVLHPSCGAVLLFLGTARDNFGERTVTHLAYEAYEEVAVAELQERADAQIRAITARRVEATR